MCVYSVYIYTKEFFNQFSLTIISFNISYETQKKSLGRKNVANNLLTFRHVLSHYIAYFVVVVVVCVDMC